MALTREIIETSSDHIDATAKLLIISLIRELEAYRNYANIFSTKIAPAIDATEGTIRARQLNGILKEIEKLGVGVVEIRGNKEGLWYNQQKERFDLIMQLFTTLFDDAAMTGSGSDNVVVKSKGNYGVAAIGQRPCFHRGGPCSCK